MKPIPGLYSLLERATAKKIFGTKMRSVIKQASRSGIASVVDQQLELAERILGFGLVPIIEPEVDIHRRVERLHVVAYDRVEGRRLRAMALLAAVTFRRSCGEPPAPRLAAERTSAPGVPEASNLSSG